MSPVAVLEHGTVYLLAGALFLAGVVQLLLCIDEFDMKRTGSAVADCLVFALLFAAAVALSVGVENPTSGINAHLPWVAVLLVCAASMLYAGIKLIVRHRRRVHSIHPGSIKEAMDNLPTGVFFADETGREVLKNRVIDTICLSVSGINPGTLSELLAVLDAMEKPEVDYPLYLAADGSVWHYRSRMPEDRRLEGYCQVTLQDVTKLYEANLALEQENERLKITNHELALMLSRLSDRIREQEVLALKTQIHNDIGVSLIALSALFEKGLQEEDVDLQLALLQNAVGYFSNNRYVDGTQDLEHLRLHALRLGVHLIIKGDITSLEELISAAAEVCITNCVMHAGGDEVMVEIVRKGERKRICLTNNGAAPSAPIREGGGLSSLRKMAESLGATMRIESAPRFMLVIEMGEEND